MSLTDEHADKAHSKTQQTLRRDCPTENWLMENPFRSAIKPQAKPESGRQKGVGVVTQDFIDLLTPLV